MQITILFAPVLFVIFLVAVYKKLSSHTGIKILNSYFQC